MIDDLFSTPAFALSILVWSGAVWALALVGREVLRGRNGTGQAGAQQGATPPTYWLAAIALVLLPFVIFVLASLFPGLKPGWLTLASAAPDVPTAPSAFTAPTDSTAPFGGAAPLPSTGAEPVAAGPDWRAIGSMVLGYLIPVLTIVYACGVLFSLARLALGRRRIAQIVAAARPASPLVGDAPVRARLLVTERAMTAFAWAPLSRNNRRGDAIVLPTCLIEKLPADRLNTIIAHEAAHLHRRDPQTGMALAVLGALFWVSPFVRHLIGEWRLAAELACDAAALEGASPAMRKAYAQTLIDALRIPTASALPCPAAAFSTTKLKDEKMRLTTILKGRAPFASSLKGRLALAAGTAAIAIAGGAGAAAMAPDAPPRLEDNAYYATLQTAPTPPTSATPAEEPAPAPQADVQPMPEPAPAPSIERYSRDPDVRTVNNFEDDNGDFKQVIVYKDGTRVERSWEDLSPEEQQRIMEDVAQAERDIAQAQRDIEQAQRDMEITMRDIETMEFGLDAAERERMIADIENSMDDIRAETMLAESERARIIEEMQTAIQEIREEEVISAEERQRIREEVRAEMEESREEMREARADLERELEEMRELNRKLREERNN